MEKPTVKIIAPTIQVEKNDYNIIKSTQKKRVCAYCRVSTNMEEQETSYKSQVEYYTKMINEHEGWTFVGIYADEGITGTSMRKRKEFLRMIDDAMEGKIDMILCKSISRFARNTVDCLTILEQLKTKNVPVLFEIEHLNSLDDERATRLRITLESASAQEFSENLSHSVKWGKIQRIEQGHISLHKVYGYNIVKSNIKGEDPQYEINLEESKIIKYIFDSYIEGYSTFQIAKMLTDKGVASPQKGKRWHEATILRMLHSEVYVGDLLLQKTISTDIKTRKRIKNTTEKKYFIENHHPAIISRSMADRVAKEFEYRKSLRGYSASGKSSYTSIYPFSNKLYCLDCGSKMRRHYYTTPNKGKTYTWVCINHKIKMTECNQKAIKEDDLKSTFVRAMNKIIENQDEFMETIRANIQDVVSARIGDDAIGKLDSELALLQKQMIKLVEESVNDRTGKVMEESQKLMAKIAEVKLDKEQRERERDRFGYENLRVLNFEEYLSKNKVFDEFNDCVFRKLVERVNIKDNEATFIFNDMIRVTEEIG